MNKLSVVMIVKNEEAVLDKCLESVKEADEIVILDTGSEDKTKEIALKYTDKFFENEYKWNDDFAEARNYAKNKATGDWILSIDADETLEEGGIQKIRKAIEETKFNSVDVIMTCNTNRFFYPRIFKNIPELFWKGAIHECINKSDQNREYDITITYGSSPAHKTDPNRSLRILEKAVKDNPDVKREMFYLGREYTYKKEWEKAIYWLETYLERATWKPEKADAFYLLAKSYWIMQRGDDARTTCAQAIILNANFKAAIELMSEMHFPKNKKRWLEFAEGATNEDVLFTRNTVATPKLKHTMPQKDFLILGHPRSGTGYMAQLFTKLGYPVGHEVYGKHGIASWLFAVDVDRYPQFYFVQSGKPSNNPNDTRSDFSYKHAIHVIRNPLDTIASTAFTENTMPESLEFRKKHVAIFGNALQQATLSYLGWNKLIEAQRPSLTIRVEDAEEKVVEFLKANEYVVGEDLKFPQKDINTREHKRVTFGDLKRELHPEVFAELTEFCKKHNYISRS
jgi:glycosyltransferase involved in cell wall biosynthesis